jgi:hypothetical protein
LSAEGKWVTFEPPAPSLPAIEEEEATAITPTSAHVRARINPDGSETQYEVWVRPGCSDPCDLPPAELVKTGRIPAGTKTKSIGAGLKGLPPGAPYEEYWVTATNANGTTLGVHQRF